MQARGNKCTAGRGVLEQTHNMHLRTHALVKTVSQISVCYSGMKASSFKGGEDRDLQIIDFCEIFSLGLSEYPGQGLSIFLLTHCNAFSMDSFPSDLCFNDVT